MLRHLILGSAMLAATACPALAQTYSITITGYCDHLTVVKSGSTFYGASDTSGCDQSIVIGGGKKKVFSVGGDLGYGPSEAWSWAFTLGKGGNGTGVLTGTDGTNVLGPISFAVTYTQATARTAPPANNHLPSVRSLFRHN